jgi:xylulokinase
VSGPYVIGCDVGSQGTNAALYSVDGTLVASAYEPHRLAFPRPAWAEQDPEDWTRALHATIARLVKTVPEGPSAVKALSFGSQLDGIVICDSRGRPLRPALIWMDRRAEAEAAALAEQISPADFYHHVGVNLDSSHAAFKAMWVREQEPETFAQAARVMPPGSYVARKAAGVLAVDFSNASSLALLDPRSLTWSQPVLDLVGLDPGLLPELAPSIQPVGKVDAAFADATGLSPDTMVVLGCGDEMAATLGGRRVHGGRGLRRRGHGRAGVRGVRAAQRGSDDACRVPPARRSRWVAAREPGFVSGGSLRWWRDEFGIGEKEAEARGAGDAYDLLTQTAARIAPGSEGLVFLPCLQGAMAPEWNGAARGVFYGLSLAHTRAHLLRALLEGSAFALRDVLEAMRGAGLGVHRITIVGGGAKGPLWRQIKADVTGLPVRVPRNVETTAAGAAIIAAVGSGECPGIGQAVASFVTFEPDEHEPDAENRDAYEDAYRLYREVYFALKPVFGRGRGDMSHEPGVGGR